MGLHKKYTEATYNEVLKDKPFSPLEPYKGITTKIKHLCHTCNNIWETQPRQILSGVGCRHCYQLKVRKPIEQVKSKLALTGWNVLNDIEYKNSYSSLHFIHSCGTIVKSSIEVITRTDNHKKRCPKCEPYKLKKSWSNPVRRNNKIYSSVLEADCCEFLIEKFGSCDIELQKQYSIDDKRTCDAYIISLDTYVEISSIGKEWYLERIYKKRQLVLNFIFVSSLEQLQQFF